MLNFKKLFGRKKELSFVHYVNNGKHEHLLKIINRDISKKVDFDMIVEQIEDQCKLAGGVVNRESLAEMSALSFIALLTINGVCVNVYHRGKGY